MEQLQQNFIQHFLKSNNTSSEDGQNVEIPQSYKESIQQLKNTLPENNKIDKYIHIYYKYLTEDDINELTKFSSSPFGAKFKSVSLNLFKDSIDLFFKQYLNSLLKQPVDTVVSSDPVEIPQSYKEKITRLQNIIYTDLEKTTIGSIDSQVEKFTPIFYKYLTEEDINDLTPIFYKYLTEEDINDLTEFNLSPIGIKIREVSPKMISDILSTYSNK